MLKRINMKYNSQYTPFTIDLFKSSFDGLNKNKRTLNAIFDMFAQQTYMHENNVHVCANLIVSIFQPHVRPIKKR